MKRPRVAIAGLGLIGGSLARALVRRGYHVTGVDSAPVRRRARAAGAVSVTSGSLERALRGADLLVLAASPRANLALLRRARRASTAGLVITDVTSVKVPICREAERLGVERFVGGHPMAGLARSGFVASDPELFRQRTWALVPARSAAATRAVRALVRAVGARPLAVEAARHDRAVAFLSHVPQVVSWALLEAARRDPVTARHLTLAGPGFQDMTRLAASPRGLWREILDDNAGEVRRALAVFRRALRP